MNEQTKRFLVVGAVGLLVLFVLVWSALGRMEGFWVSGAGLGTWFCRLSDPVHPEFSL